jgi:hypothetical protein
VSRVFRFIFVSKLLEVKFSVGDKVVVKHTKEEGKVIQIINNEMVELEVLNTHFPAFVDELDHPYLEMFTSKKINARKKALNLDDFPGERPGMQVGNANAHPDLASGFYFSILPVYFFDKEGDSLARLKLYFINQSQHTIKMKYDCMTNLGKEFTLGTTLYPYQHLYLHHIPFDLVNENLSFNFELETIAKLEVQKRLEHNLKLKPKVIFQKLHQLEERGEPLLSFQIAEDFPIVDLAKLVKAKDLFGLPPAKPSHNFQLKKKVVQNHVLDLHIENLVSDYHHMSNAEKITAQLAACEQAVMDAYSNQQASIIIVHGIGAGKLKEEVHRLLKAMRKQVRQFENKYSQKYGFGATEVFLRF